MVWILLLLLLFVILVVAYWYWSIVPPSEEKKREVLKDKVVVITGASSGLGKACCFAFQKYGCKIVLCSRNIEELNNVKQQLEDNALLWKSSQENKLSHLVFKLDLADTENMGNVVQEIAQSCDNKIDILVNNAGVSHRGSILSTKLDIFTHLMIVNFFGQVALTKALLPFMASHSSGHIVGVGSVQSKIAIPFRAPYAASKHAAQAFYDTLRSEVAIHKVYVTTVNPAYIKTNLSLNALCGDGSKHGKMDSTTKNGMSAELVADEIVNAVVKRKHEVVLAPFHHRLAVWIRVAFPTLYFWIMRKRAGN